MLVDLKRHCLRLSEIIYVSNLTSDWEKVSEWLQLAAAIKNVEVDTIQFDYGFGYCSQADYYGMAREKLLNEFILELSRFNLVWGGLESCLNKIKLPKHPNKSKRGKISHACYYLQEYFELKPSPSYLSEEIGVVAQIGVTNGASHGKF